MYDEDDDQSIQCATYTHARRHPMVLGSIGGWSPPFQLTMTQLGVLLASVLPRAIETASIIAPGLGLEVSGQECDLCEVHPGEADGLTWTEYAARYGSFDMEAEPDRVFAPAGDSWNSFHERVKRTLERVARDHEGQTVVAVCHAGVIMASMRVLLGIPQAGTGARLRPTNTGLTEWEHDRSLDRWTLHSFNDAGHLLGLAGRTAA